MAITESLLEMHYHRALLKLFAEFFGKGGVDFSLYKYSQSKEKFVGFDQAYALTNMTDDDFYAMVKAASAVPPTAAAPAGPKFLCYFLQYKVVREMINKSKHLPPTITSRPYYRSTLDTTRKSGDPSQHERLFNLSRRPKCFVYYACPMIFDKSDLYRLSPSLDDLALADVATCASDYTDNDKHFLYFDTTSANPVWRSEPVEGRSIRPRELLAEMEHRLRERSPTELAQAVLDDVSSVATAGDTALDASDFMKFRAGLRLMEDSVWFIRVG